MQLTIQQTKLVERLRKEERGWPLHRWIMLTAGAFVYLSHGYLVLSLYRRDFFKNVNAETVLLWPGCLIAFVMATWMLVVAIRDWRDNPNRVLLLKLIDELQENTPADRRVA